MIKLCTSGLLNMQDPGTETAEKLQLLVRKSVREHENKTVL
jgi:hypothetical protein